MSSKQGSCQWSVVSCGTIRAELEQLEEVGQPIIIMSLLVQDQVAVITGATGGIGRAVALELARGGGHVVVHAHRRIEQAKRLADEIVRLGRQATVLEADLSDGTACEAFTESAWRWKSSVNVLINLAGADVLTGKAAYWPFEKKLAALWQVDVLATIRLARLF